jgi:hypothetical protein
MRRAPFAMLSLAVGVSLPLVACLQQVSTGTGTTDPSSGAATSPTAAATTGATPQGSGCATDPATGVTLCQAISVCPGLLVDQGPFPGCGFRIHNGAVIDLECLCGDSLCPIGVPDSCSEATQLLSSQNEPGVCDQVAEGRCTQVGASDAAAAPTSTSSTCDTTCRNECAGEPGCIQLCGC